MRLSPYEFVAPPPGTNKRWPLSVCHVLRVALAVILLLAAGLKAEALATDPHSQDSLFSTPRIQIATIQMEVVLAIWLLSGLALRGAWIAAIGFFTAVAIVSLYLAVEGQPSCGCFGRVAISPWISLVFDLVVLTILLLRFPAPSHPTSRSLAGFLQAGLVAVGLLALFAGGFFFLQGDPSRRLAHLRGEVITLEPALVQLGEATAGEERQFQIQLNNISDRPITLIGGTSS